MDDLLGAPRAVHLFGDYEEWAISEDDGCLRFHPNWHDTPLTVASHLWSEAWDEVQRLGGHAAVVEMLRRKARATGGE